MFLRYLIAGAAVALAAALTGRRAAAQIDYRNLDEGRPVHTEDAYAVERYAFELVLPYAYEDERGPGWSHLVAPELAYGVLLNMHVGVKLPLAALEPGGYLLTFTASTGVDGAEVQRDVRFTVR